MRRHNCDALILVSVLNASSAFHPVGFTRLYEYTRLERRWGLWFHWISILNVLFANLSHQRCFYLFTDGHSTHEWCISLCLPFWRNQLLLPLPRWHSHHPLSVHRDAFFLAVPSFYIHLNGCSNSNTADGIRGEDEKEKEEGEIDLQRLHVTQSLGLCFVSQSLCLFESRNWSHPTG